MTKDHLGNVLSKTDVDVRTWVATLYYHGRTEPNGNCTTCSLCEKRRESKLE